MIFNLHDKTKRGVAAALAAGVVAVGLGGGIAAAANPKTAGSSAPPAHALAAPAATNNANPISASQAKRSTVPASLKRAETAAEDVITYLEHGKTTNSPPNPALSRSEAQTLKRLAHGQVASELTRAGVPASKIKALQQRADQVERLSRTGASKLQVSLAANHVSQLMPGLYARYHDPVPTAVLRLDYLDRQIQLRAMAGQMGHVKRLVRAEAATWAKLRPQLVASGGTQVARQYDAHVRALSKGGSVTVAPQAAKGLDIVDRMEAAFLGK